MNYFFKAIGNAVSSLVIAAVLLCGCNSTGGDTSANTTADSTITAAPDATKNDDWVPLFNGKTFAGWHTHGTDSVGSAWKAEAGAIHLDASAKNDWQTKGGGDLVSDEEYQDFDLKLDWKISEGGNSGIIFYVHEDTTQYKNTWESGPEMQVCDNAKNEDGKLVKHKAGDLYDMLSSSSEKVVKPAGEWNAVEIKSEDGKLDFFMNNEHTLSATIWDDAWKKLVSDSKFKSMEGFGTYRKGRIALQDHGADVWFRNVMIRKL